MQICVKIRSMNTISIKMTDAQIKSLKQQFSSHISNKKPAYVDVIIQLNDCVITIYESKKVIFQGKNASYYAPQTKEEYPQAGSDEVGTGDYLGPVVVCACLINQKDLKFLENLNIKDSKQLTDDAIREVAPKLMEQLTYSLLILDNIKYNQIHLSNNMNQIKAKLHNKAYAHLRKKAGYLPDFCIVDQFTPKNSYYNYLKGEPEIIDNLHFETKAESKYLSVAVASMIARYAFLKAMDKIESYYHVKIPKGAGIGVDEFAQQFVHQYGIEEFKKICKFHFKNTEKIRY